MSKPRIAVGDKLWFVPGQRRGEAREVTVLKVGRVWAYLSDMTVSDVRMDIHSFEMDGHGYSSPGKCYASRDEYKRIIGVSTLWNAFIRRVQRPGRPEDITEADIRAAAAILHIEIEES